MSISETVKSQTMTKWICKKAILSETDSATQIQNSGLWINSDDTPFLTGVLKIQITLSFYFFIYSAGSCKLAKWDLKKPLTKYTPYGKMHANPYFHSYYLHCPWKRWKSTNILIIP